MEFVSGTVYSGAFPLDNMFCNVAEEWLSPAAPNYWLSENGQTTDQGFVADLGSGQTAITGVKLVNTHNNGHKDRSTQQFRVSMGDSASGPWTEKLTESLADSRQQDPPPLQTFTFDSDSQRFLKFEMLQYYGSGGGLKYFDVVRG